MRSLEWPGASAVAQHHRYCDVQTSDRDINANSVWAIIEIVQVFATCGIVDIRTTSTVALEDIYCGDRGFRRYKVRT